MQQSCDTSSPPQSPSDMGDDYVGDDGVEPMRLTSPVYSHFSKDPAENSYDTVKARFELQCFMIQSPFLYGIIHEHAQVETSFLKHNELKQYFCNWVYFEPCQADEKNPSGWKSMRFIDAWLLDLTRREVTRVVVDPRNSEVGAYNLWKPLTASQLDPIEPSASYEELLAPIIHHIHSVMTEQNIIHTNWLIDWMANMVQRPYQRSQVAILLYGKQGCGKGIIIDWMRKAVLGDACSFQTADPEHDILGRFANGLTNKVLVQIDEVKSLVNHADALKNIITNSTLRHEKKGRDIIVVDNLANLIFTSNNENVLAVPSDDRRFVFFRCSSLYRGDKAYFDSLGVFLDSPGIDRLFFQFLMQVTVVFLWVCLEGFSNLTRILTQF
jgi:Family of unknown function (DUF5906)